MKKLLKERFQASHLKILLRFHKKWEGHDNYYFSNNVTKARQWLLDLTSEYPIRELREEELDVIYIHVLYYATSMNMLKELNENGEDSTFYEGVRFILSAISSGVYPWNFEE